MSIQGPANRVEYKQGIKMKSNLRAKFLTYLYNLLLDDQVFRFCYITTMIVYNKGLNCAKLHVIDFHQ